MPRVKRVTRAQKPQGKCGKCGTPVEKGDGYVWWPPYFRSRAKAVRCTKSECYPKPSELDNSKKQTILAAQEAFEAEIDTLTDQDTIEAAVATVAEAVREVADEYREALDAWEHGNSALEELADHYESQADELEGFTLSTTPEEPTSEEPEEPQQSDYPEAPEDEESEYDEAYNVWCSEQADYDQERQAYEDDLEEARNEAREVVDSIDLL